MQGEQFVEWANYLRGGLWSLIRDFSESYKLDFSLGLNVQGVSPVLVVQNQDIHCYYEECSFRGSTKVEIVSNGRVLVPLSVGKYVALYYLAEAEVGTGVSLDVFASFRDVVQLFLERESRLENVYPTALPLLMGVDSLLTIKANEALFYQGIPKTFFLNGQQYSGKKTWFQMFARLNGFTLGALEFDVGKNVQIFKKSEGVLYSCFEVALLSAQEQNSLLDRLGSGLVVLMSKYPIELLLSKGIVVADLAAACKENQLAFPSFSASIENVSLVASFWSLLKGFGEVSADRCSSLVGSNIVKIKEAVLGRDSSGFSVERIIGQGGGLRDLVSNIDRQAIRYAHTVVGNSQNKIAKMLGISRGSLQHKIKKYNLPYGEWD